MPTAHGLTDLGRVRHTNEDSLLVDPALRLFIVADGMGGQQAGEVASNLAVDAVRGFFARSQEGHDFTWPYGIDATLSFQGNRLMTAIKLANRRVFKLGESRDDYAGLGTTIVAAIVADGHLTFTGVGDSRIYVYAGGTLEQVTVDDSWASTVLARDLAVDREAFASHPMRHVLTNVLGARDQIELDVDERPIAGHERVLLCSDGLHGALDDATLSRVLGAAASAADASTELVRLALERDGGDNITALVIDLTPEDTE